MNTNLNQPKESASKGNILAVDDTPNNLKVLSAILSQQGYKVRCALSGEIALRAAKTFQPDLILLDIKMPVMNGYEVCQILKAEAITQDIPIIFLSALDQPEDIVKAFQIGGVDYVSKPFKVEELLARVSNHLNLRSAQLEIQHLNDDLEQRVRQRTAQLEQEIKQRLQAQEEVMYVATHDSLTELPNRVLLTQSLAQKLSQQSTTVEDPALLLLQYKQLQVIRNSLGHNAVDQLLISASHRLKQCLDSRSMLAYFGEDTFAILVDNPISHENILKLARQLQQEMSLPFTVEERPIYVQVRVGIALYSQSYGQTASHLIRDACIALNQTNSQGAETIQFFNPEMHHQALSFFSIQNDLHSALKQDELMLVYQPIFSIVDNSLKGAEALVRWHHPQKGVIGPGEFIPIAEETELIVQLDRYVLYQACRQLKTWQDEKLLTPSFQLRVNLSALQLVQADFLDVIKQILHETQADLSNLALEITEYGLMQELVVISNILEQLRHYGINISIDDFGTGYSSLSYLNRLRVENLKIDRSFVSQIDGTPASLKVIQLIINLAHELEMTVTAEGIETEQQLSELRSLGCEFAQGYFLAKPMDTNHLTSRLQQALVA